MKPSMKPTRRSRKARLASPIKLAKAGGQKTKTAAA
jgi:hypothetical protein